MLNRIPIKLQISLSFFVILALLSIVAVSAVDGLRQLTADVVTYRGLARDTNLANEVQTNLSSMRLNVKDFLITHSDKDLDQYQEYLDLMNANLDTAVVEIQAPQRAENVSRIIELRDDYVGRFTQVVDLVKQEDSLVDDQLNTLGTLLRQRLTDIMRSAYDDNDANAAYRAGIAQEQLLLGRLYLAKFHSTHEQDYFDRTQKEIVKNLGVSIGYVDKQLQSPRLRKLLQEFQSDYAKFVDSLNLLHDIITRRNELVLEGLDKIGPQIAQLSISVKESVKADQDNLGPRVQAASKSLTTKIGIESIIAMVVGFVLALFLIRSIWRPLGAEPTTLLQLIERIGSGDLNSAVKGEDKKNSGVFAGMLEMRTQLSKKIAEERAAASENSRLRQALDNTTTNVMVANTDNKIVYMNRRADELFTNLESDLKRVLPKFDASTLIGTNIDIFHRDPSHQQNLLKSLQSTHTADLTVGNRQLKIIANPIVDTSTEQANRLGTVVEWMDLTDTVRLEKEKTELIERERNDALEINEKVAQILSIVNKAANGDLSERLQVSGNDAVGQVGSCLASFFDELSSNLTIIGQTADSISVSSRGLSTINVGLNSAARETSSQADLVSTTSEKINDNVSSVATAAVQMTVSVREIANSASEAAAVATEAVKLAENTDERVKQLSVSSQDVGNVVKVISSIAEQTNLLALNATIEAARAGESGKGFAVVANEVKELAKQTALATDEISLKISAIQNDSEIAVSAIGDINNTISKIHEIQTTIAGAVEEQSATTREISRSVTEAATGTAEIADSILEVAKGAEQARDETQNAQAATQKQEDLAETLNTLVSKFTLRKG